MRKYLWKLPRSTEELIHWHERYISPATLVIGFTIDTLIFRRVDLIASYFLLFSYLVTAAVGITLFHLIQLGKLRGRIFLAFIPFIPSIIQFAFGGLFSGFVILYSQSAAYATSWIFIVILAALLIGNERFRTLYTQLAFQATIFFAVLVSFCVFFLPVLFLRIGTGVFLVSQAVSVVVMLILLRAFGLLAPQILREAQWKILRSVGSILFIFNVLYFTNAIPPIPLALKEAGVYHSVVKKGDDYYVTAEPLSWYQRYLRYNTVFHKRPNEDAFVYTAVFAPTKLSTTILHEWEYWDADAAKWIRTGTVGYSIVGGRDGGYRGYTIGDVDREGSWRVNVRTGEGKLIGTVAFTVEFVDKAPVTMQEIR